MLKRSSIAALMLCITDLEMPDLSASIQLLKSLCIPIILYSVDVLYMNKSTLASLDNVIDRAVFCIFRCNMTGDIKYIRNMFGLLPVLDIAVCRLHGFLRKYYNCFFPGQM